MRPGALQHTAPVRGRPTAAPRPTRSSDVASRPLAALVALLAALALAPAAGAAPRTGYYLSLGDSYASGAQPGAAGRRAGNSIDGFAYQTVTQAAKRGYRLTLVNVACGGATTTSLLEREGCPKVLRGPGAKGYETRTQMAEAERFLRKYRGRVALVTVSIGGNDVTACARAADPVACIGAATKRVRANVATIAERLRKAGGRGVRIVGTTYPDVLLGQYTKGTEADRRLAQLSVVAFRSFVNPALKQAYAEGDGRFVDVTRETGAYGSFSQTEQVAPYGALPRPVAEVCRLTWFCEVGDIHARRSGYRVIADMIAATLPRRR